MKEIVSISLGSSSQDYAFTTTFLGKQFSIRRFGTDGSEKRAIQLIKKWELEADAIGLGMVPEHYSVGTKRFYQRKTERLESHVKLVPVTTGSRLRNMLQRWAIRDVQIELDNYFDNARVLFLDGMLNYDMAAILSEFTQNLSFADPLLHLGVPKILTSLNALELFAAGSHKVLRWKPSKSLSPNLIPVHQWNQFVLRKAAQKANIIIGPFEYIKNLGFEELVGKTIITSTISEARFEWLKEQGVNLAVDVSPQIFEHVVGINVTEAMIINALDKDPEELTNEDYLEIMRDYDMGPRLLYPQGKHNKVVRFAFVIHPLSQEYFKQVKPVEVLSHVSPPVFLSAVEKIMAHSPPFVYSTVKGVKSPQGIEAEGWLISVGGTPREMLAHSPEFTYRRLLKAAKMAERLGAQIMGLGAFTKVVGDAGVTVAKRANIPITTGNSYSASAALWAAADATRRLGLVKLEKGQKVKGKAMVVGATGSIGAVSARLLAMVAEEVYLIAPRPDKLLELQKSIQQETPNAKIFIATRADAYLHDMDIIVTSTSGAGKQILDIMKVKPGCVITDVARPLDLPPSEVAKRPDVLVIESGEIKLPGEVKMKNIGLPAPNIAYACLAETIVLALEGRLEVFTVGRNIEWEKVKDIYQMGLRHGMQLAAITGVNGVFTDEDIANIRERALEARKTFKPNTGKKTKASETA